MSITNNRQMTGQRLVLNVPLVCGHHVRLRHRFRGWIEGHLTNYDDPLLTIRPKGEVASIYINKGLVLEISQKIK